MIHVQRQQDRILLWDYEHRNPIILEHEEAVDLAQTILDLAGRMKQANEEETIIPYG